MPALNYPADSVSIVAPGAVAGGASGAIAGTGEQAVYDLTGLTVIPGLIDIHFHGSVGHDFMEGTPEALHAIATFQASQGVTAICPATMTMPEADIVKACANAKDFVPTATEAELVGINMEGPFISPRKVGAQNPEYVHSPDIDFFHRCYEASGKKIKLMAIAPEEEHALATIAALKDEVLPSIAHTCTSYEIASEAIRLGATHLTHMYNAMPGLAHRDPGPIAAASDASWCEAELICDGVHIHPAAVRAAFRLMGAERMILISDSMMAAGLPDGEYELGGQAVFVKNGKACLASGTIAGSVSNLYYCMKTAHQIVGLPLETTVRCATFNPARSIGILKDYGTIAPGKVASLVVLNPDLSIKDVLIRGKWLHNAIPTVAC